MYFSHSRLWIHSVAGGSRVEAKDESNHSMALLCNSSFVPLKRATNGFFSIPLTPPSSSCSSITDLKKMRRKPVVAVKAIQAIINPFEDPILKDALKEPVAFLGGAFAGLMRLDLKEEPLREWISRTVEVAGAADGGDVDGEGVEAEEDAPQQIEIE